MTVTSAGRPSVSHPLERLLEDSELLVAADEAASIPRRGPLATGARLDPQRPPRGDGSALPFRVSGSSSRYSMTSLVLA